ncbi:MAG TPA: hypothetical protein VM008_21760 [Phycisphaerae bacterium]|nr:hypothetical protein [Phycisphaerae bacterium]
MSELEPKKAVQRPDAPIKACAALSPMAVAKLAQARIKTLADIRRLTDEELKALPLGVAEYNAVKKYAASISFEGEGGEEKASPG